MRLVSVSPYVTSAQAPYAGHVFYDRMLRAWQRHVDVLCLAPDNEGNRAAVSAGPPCEVRLLTPHEATPFLGRLGRALRLPRPSQLIQVPDLRHAEHELAVADVVDLQWSQTLELAAQVRACAEGAQLIAVEYDVLFTTVGNFLPDPARPWHLIHNRLQASLVRRLETGALGLCDRYVVFKEADAELLRSLGVRSQGYVVHPTLHDPGAVAAGTGCRVLFVGAFDREENVRGARWFVQDVWPTIRARVPEARLVLAGSGVRDEVAALAGEAVEVTGFVPDLDPLYRDAALAIAPLFGKGGIRFKVPQAMLYGLPVVATSEALVGLDGLPRGAVEGPHDRAGAFADAVVRLLRSPAERARMGSAARGWVRRTFDGEATIERLITATLEAIR